MSIRRIASAPLWLAALLSASTIRVQSTIGCGTADQCFSPATPENLAAAYKAAFCGDTIEVEAGADVDFVNVSQRIRFSKSCPGKPITFTTTADPSWLPDPHARILPSYRNLVPRFRLNADLSKEDLDSLFELKATGITFNKVGFFLGRNYVPGSAISMPGSIYLYWFKLTGSDEIAFNQTLWYNPSYSTAQWIFNIADINLPTFLFTNSYLGGLHGRPQSIGGQESKVFLANAGGPWYFVNNFFCCAWTTTLLVGGNPILDSTGKPMLRQSLFEDNIGVNALRFMPGSPNEVPSNVKPMIKNFFELKNGINTTWRFNTFVNSWLWSQGQWFGTKISNYNEAIPRGYWELGVPNAVATLDTGDNGPNTKVTITGANAQLWAIHTGSWIGLARTANPDESQYLNGGNDDWQYRTVTRIEQNDAQGNVFHVDAPYTQAFTMTRSTWNLVINPWTYTADAEIYGNVFRNVSTMLAYEGSDPSRCCAPTSRVNFHDNLQLFDSPYADFSKFSTPGWMFKIDRGGSGLTIEHNTSVRMPTAHANEKLTAFFTLTAPRDLPLDGLSLRSNLSSESTYGGMPGPAIAAYSTANVKLSYNSFIGTAGSNNGTNQFSVNNYQCGGGRICQPNYFSDLKGSNTDYRFTNPAANDFSIRSDEVDVCGVPSIKPLTITTCSPHTFLPGQAVRFTGLLGIAIADTLCENSPDGRNCFAGYAQVASVPDNKRMVLSNWTDNVLTGLGLWLGGGKVSFALSKGAHDGDDVGARMDQVALIQYLTVKPSAHSAQFSWRMPAGLSDRVCQLEVSPDSGLINDDADYTVVAALDPTFFKRADHDNSNPRATVDANGIARTFKAGDERTVTGDDGQPHDLNLKAGTRYYYRLLCGGAMERGSFDTMREHIGRTH